MPMPTMSVMTAPLGATPPSKSTSPTGASSPASSAANKTREVAPFLKNLRKMLEEESTEVLRWTPDGRAFEIHDMERMMDYVLPKYFKHRKYTSFQRQLNYFNFRKWTKSKAVVCTFSNEFFLRDRPDIAWRITRKKSVHATTPKAATRKMMPHCSAAYGAYGTTWKREGMGGFGMQSHCAGMRYGDVYASPTDADMVLLDNEVGNANPNARHLAAWRQQPSGHGMDPLDWFDEFMPPMEQAAPCRFGGSDNEPICSARATSSTQMLHAPQYPSPSSYSVLPSPADFGGLCAGF